MHEWTLLGLAAAAFYLIECCAWIAVPCQACVRDPLRRRWRAIAGADAPGNDRGGLVLTSPVNFSGAVVQSCGLPFTVDPDGLSNLSLAERDDPEPEYIAFADIEHISPVLDTVRINDRPFIEAPSAVAAAEVAALLEALKSARPRDRQKVIHATIADRVSTKSVETRWQWFLAETRAVRLASTCATAWVFVAAPIVLLLFGPVVSWPFLLAGLLACGVIASALYFRAHRRLFGVAASDRWVHALAMALFPLAACRACDRLSKELMWRFDPIALVAAFCHRQAHPGIMRPMVFDISRRVAATSHPAAVCRAWHHDVLTNEVERVLRRIDCDPLAAPAREDAMMAAFCPRCHTQYAAGRDTCAVCAGVPLEPFGAIRSSKA